MWCESERIKQIEYRRKNIEKVRLQARESMRKARALGKANGLVWYYKNKERARLLHGEWYRKNSKRSNEYASAYRAANLDKIKAQKSSIEARKKRRIWEAQKRETSINFKLSQNMRSRIRGAMKHGKSGRKTVALIGCTIDELRLWIESQFKEGMNWGNYGPRGWHIDHKKPCAAFDLGLEAERLSCFNYRNLQPLWAIENIKKGDKFDGEPIANMK